MLVSLHIARLKKLGSDVSAGWSVSSSNGRVDALISKKQRQANNAAFSLDLFLFTGYILYLLTILCK